MRRLCSDHAGEPFPPRCGRCDVLSATRTPLGYLPGTECIEHPWYPLICLDPAVCAKCVELVEAEEETA